MAKDEKTKEHGKDKDKARRGREKSRAESEAEQAAKQSPEAEAIEAEKKARKAAKREKRKREQAEAQVREQLSIEAEKAQARFEALDRLREQEDKEIKTLRKEIKAQNRDDDHDRASQGASLTPDGKSTKQKKSKMPDDDELRDMALDRIMERELGPFPTAVGLHSEAESEKKRKRKEKKRAIKRRREAENEVEESSADGVPEVKHKKKKRKVEPSNDDDGNDGNDEHEKHEKPKDKKDKKKKKKEGRTELEVTSDKITDSMDLDKVSQEKKHKKRKHQKASATAGNVATEPIDVDEVPNEKKGKNKSKHEIQEIQEKRSSKDDSLAPTSTVVGASNTNTNGADRWNVSALEVDDKRKNRFLRLLGANKAGNSTSNSSPVNSTTSKAELSRMQSDLERQFDTGMKMKQDGQSRRKGLGA
ncbi:small acidic protein family-domain-containing protein [Xylaria sp. CBS 124048]|nr:small acidic protein family-domain-containing protein [Xylaria sp. CBS 124048]